MTDMPLVSVVVPVYNVEKYLDRCVQSVVGQTYDNLEIILVDDGSTDGSAVICDNWASSDGRIKVIHKKNAGLGMARNSGMDSAGGKYIFFSTATTTLIQKRSKNASRQPKKMTATL